MIVKGETAKTTVTNLSMILVSMVVEQSAVPPHPPKLTDVLYIPAGRERFTSFKIVYFSRSIRLIRYRS